MKFKPSYEDITNQLETIVGENNVHYGIRELGKDQDEMIVYFPVRLEESSICMFDQEIAVIYVTKQREDLREGEILDALNKLYLSDIEVEYTHQLKGEALVDIVYYRCHRKGKRNA